MTSFYLRFPGLNEDAKLVLFYNRFRYYDCDAEQFISAVSSELSSGTNPLIMYRI